MQMNVPNERITYSVVSNQKSISVGKKLRCTLLLPDGGSQLIITSNIDKISYLNDNQIMVGTKEGNYIVSFDPKYIAN
ncbi:MAG: hypothetical protein PHH22_02270 [Clostridia bacterium]|nr:hypothetical protein [Clostridia bacterium]